MELIFSQKPKFYFLVIILFSCLTFSQEKSNDSIKVKQLDEVLVSAVRATLKAPVSFSNLSSKDFQSRNLGQDIPILMNFMPSVVTTSDAGNGVGYTGIRVRGSDATRVNVTINGIPYNDSESNGTFFVNLPDFASSVESLQLQRGVGTSTNGAGAFGASLNMYTDSYSKNSSAEISNSVGSFNTIKNTVKFSTGLLNDHFEIAGRLSQINSDGYIDRASSNLNSHFLQATYVGKTTLIKALLFGGKEKTYQSWYGVDGETMNRDRTFNFAGMYTDAFGNTRFYDNQTDNYQQDHFQLHWNEKYSSKWNSNLAVHYTKGKGYYEEYKAAVNVSEYQLPSNQAWNSINPDLIRQRWLQNNFYGQIMSVEFKKEKNTLTIGGGWNQYDGMHFGKLPYPNIIPITTSMIYYTNDELKKEANIYAKWQYQINHQWNSFIDIQYRNVSHQMNGFDHTPDLKITRNFDFLNPKAGFTFTKGKTIYYSSIAIAHKEPNRDDFEAGTSQQPKQEILYDWESGFTKKENAFEYGANFYYMNYKDQLVLTGKINDIGAYTRMNVPKSSRIGIEIEASHKLNKQMTSYGNFTFSQNKIESFTEYIDDYDNGGQQAIQHKNTDITLSPAITASHILSYTPNHQWKINFTTKYVSKQYLDNTQNESRILKAYWTQDISAEWKCIQQPKWNALLQFHALNIFDHLYEPNGYTYSYLYGGAVSTSNNYFPMAGRNFWVSLKIDLK